MTSHAPNSPGVTIKTAPHDANRVRSGYTPVSTVEDLLKRSCPQQSMDCRDILQSSFQQHLSYPQLAVLYASSNGFAKGAIDAYNMHSHFVIRPEDGELAIVR